MEVIGVIAEYNPFHNGHKCHLEKIKELFPNSLIILILSGNFTQRGEPALISKWDRSSIALQEGVDLVVELPYPFAAQSADFFAKGAISLLKELKANYLIFGSESNDVSTLEKLASIQLNDQDYDALCKVYLRSGYNYPTALSLALKDLTGETILMPNDLLGLSYVKEIRKQKAFIKPYTIKRTNSYHSDELLDVSSASAIRKALENGEEVSKAVPNSTLSHLHNLHFMNDYFPYLKYKVLLENNLDVYQGVDEGIGPRVRNAILSSTTITEAISKISTKRYTKQKINRMLGHILVGFTKEEARKMKDIAYIRVLDYSLKGKEYLHSIKKELTIPLITNYSKLKHDMLSLEFRTTCVYALTLPFPTQQEEIDEEYKHFPKL